MTVISFTAFEAELLGDRLAIPECIADALTDYDPDTDPVPEFKSIDVQATAERLGAMLAQSSMVVAETAIEKAVLAEAVEGSHWRYFVADSVQDGDMTRTEAQRYGRALNSIERKLTAAGVKHSGFPNA